MLPQPPDEITAAAERRADARAERDWATADALKAEIEAAGWKVVDAGTSFRLEPAHPPDIEAGGEVRYGRSEAVPSRLGEPATRLATVVVIVRGAGPATVERLRTLPRGSDAQRVIVADGVTDAEAAAIRDAAPDAAEVVRTSTELGPPAALNAGIRRAMGRIVVIAGTGAALAADGVERMAEVLEDRQVAVVGARGYVSQDLHRFSDAGDVEDPAEVVAVTWDALAFRREDATTHGPLDERFLGDVLLDVWWSLSLRDEGTDRNPRIAVTLPGLLNGPRPAPPRADSRDRATRRNAYRVLDRFRSRLDLIVPEPRAWLPQEGPDPSEKSPDRP